MTELEFPAFEREDLSCPAAVLRDIRLQPPPDNSSNRSYTPSNSDSHQTRKHRLRDHLRDMTRDPRYWEQDVLSEDNDWFWSPTLVSDLVGNITESRFPSTPFLYRIEDQRSGIVVLNATVTVRNEINGQLLAQPHSSAIVPLFSFTSQSILPKLHSLPNMRRLVIEAPKDFAPDSLHKLHILNNLRHFLRFFGMLTDEGAYHNTSARLTDAYTETLPIPNGHTLSSIVLPLDLRDGLDDVLQSLSQHHELFTIEFTSPTRFSPSNIPPSVLASYICPSLQLVQSVRMITVPGDLVCVELLYNFSTLRNLAEIRITPGSNETAHGGSQFVELAVCYSYTGQHFSALRRLHIGVQRIRSSQLAQLSARFPGVRIS